MILLLTEIKYIFLLHFALSDPWYRWYALCNELNIFVAFSRYKENWVSLELMDQAVVMLGYCTDIREEDLIFEVIFLVCFSGVLRLFSLIYKNVHLNICNSFFCQANLTFYVYKFSILISMNVFQQPSRSSKKVHNFGKRSNSIKRNPNAPVVKSSWLYKQVQKEGHLSLRL